MPPPTREPPLFVRSEGFRPGHLLYPITSDSFTVGKDPANSLVVQDRFISSRHLQVTRRGASLHVRDLNSTNGTFLGDVRVFEVELPLNTVLRVGETELLFEPALQGSQAPSFHGLVGNEPAMRHLVEFLKRVAPSDAGVLILGESGTGKEVVAQALHAASPRADKPFLTINCGALPANIIESELLRATGAGEAHGRRAGQAPAAPLAGQRARAAQRGVPRPAGAQGSPAGRQRAHLRGAAAPPAGAGRAAGAARGGDAGADDAALERQLIESTLRRCGNHKDRAAKQ